MLEKEKLGKGVRPRTSKPPEDPGDVSAATRREVIARDGEQCAYVSPTGERCPARAWLEIDHRNARALGGEGTTENLRVLCAAHNKYEAEQTFGRAHVEKKIAGRRAAATASDPRIVRSQDRSIEPSATSTVQAVQATLKSALVGLGFRAKEVERVVATLSNESATRPVEELLREALAKLT